MINQQNLFRIYRSMTGKSVYVQDHEVPAMPEQKWQPSRVQEYAFRQEMS